MIFSKRKITIVGDKANIDKQIVLYRGDREIEIQFEIVYEVIRYRMSNAIEEANASFGQLIIQNDSASTLSITDVSPTNEGVVVFKFTKEMIDEISELGTYNFQIRLFDDTQTSRITTPIVENGIIIKEPLSIYEGDSKGGSAEVGVAFTGAARVQQEERLEPFDAAGNYNETTWATGDIITSGKLNKLEDGIAGVNQKVKNITVPTKTSELTNDSRFATETYVTSKIAEAQLGADTLVETILDNNLFDKNNLVTSFINKDGGTSTGNFTNYIKLESGKRYVTNLNYTQFYFFDENKNHLNTQTYIGNPQIISGNGYVLVKLPSDYSKVKVLEGTDIESYKPQHIELKSSLENNKWYGKKWLLIGDSISTDEAIYAKNGYGKLISRELGMTLTNISVSGKLMKDGYEWLDNLSDKFDLITVMLGTNNQGYNCGIGSLNDTYYQAGTYNSNNSFYAQTQLMIEKLMTKYPKSKIIFLTPIKRTGVGDDASYNDENGYFKKLATTKEYRDVIIDCCNYYSIPYIDLYNCIDPRTEVNRKLYFIQADGSDGTHPNDLGHALFLAPVIKNGIMKECPYYFNDWSINEAYINITTSISELSINEGGNGTFTVQLESAPTADKVVAISSNNTDVTVSPTNLTFTSENYATAQTVTVTVSEDDDTTNDTATITLSGDELNSKTIAITITDNDTPAVTPTTYTITNNLTNCTNSNNAISVEENASYTAILTADDGYTLDSPVITMGGTDVTSTVYSGGNINITNVTGNVVITCNATANSSTGGGDTTPVLLHSWNLSDGGTIVGDNTVYEDTVNDFDLINSGNDRYANPGKLLLGRTDSFTIILEDVTPKSVYSDFILHTGVLSGVNMWSGQTEAPYTLGRFRLDRKNSFGNDNGELKITRINTDKSSETDIYTSAPTQGISKDSIGDIKITYDANTTTGKIFLNDELAQTINGSLLVDGIIFNSNKERITISNIKIYRGVV